MMSSALTDRLYCGKAQDRRNVARRLRAAVLSVAFV